MEDDITSVEFQPGILSTLTSIRDERYESLDFRIVGRQRETMAFEIAGWMGQ